MKLTKLKVKDTYAYIWAAIDIDTKLLTIDASYTRSSIDALLLFLKRVLKRCKNKPLIVVDNGMVYMGSAKAWIRV